MLVGRCVVCQSNPDERLKQKRRVDWHAAAACAAGCQGAGGLWQEKQVVDVGGQVMGRAGPSAMEPATEVTRTGQCATDV